MRLSGASALERGSALPPAHPAMFFDRDVPYEVNLKPEYWSEVLPIACVLDVVQKLQSCRPSSQVLGTLQVIDLVLGSPAGAIVGLFCSFKPWKSLPSTQ